MAILDRRNVLFDLASSIRQVARVHVGRILGSTTTNNGPYLSLLDLLERCYFMRAELNAITGLLIKKGVLKDSDVSKAFENEFRTYLGELSKHWPELRFEPNGFVVVDMKAFAERTNREGWPA